MDTEFLHRNNRTMVLFQIQQKQDLSKPFYATKELVQSTMTDMDHFPYKRFYRGQYANPNPVVMEREAGFRPVHTECYQKHVPIERCDPGYCWQYPCSTIWPCRNGQVIMKNQMEEGQTVCRSKPNTVSQNITYAP